MLRSHNSKNSNPVTVSRAPVPISRYINQQFHPQRYGSDQSAAKCDRFPVTLVINAGSCWWWSQTGGPDPGQFVAAEAHRSQLGKPFFSQATATQGSPLNVARDPPKAEVDKPLLEFAIVHFWGKIICPTMDRPSEESLENV